MKHVTVTTAVPLTEALRQEVVETLQSRFKLQSTEYELKEVVQPAILGGISLTIDSQQYDATVRGKLNRLRD